MQALPSLRIAAFASTCRYRDDNYISYILCVTVVKKKKKVSQLKFIALHAAASVNILADHLDVAIYLSIYLYRFFFL